MEKNDIEHAISWYSDNRELYRSLAKKVKDILDEMLHDSNINYLSVECRAKTYEVSKGKLLKKHNTAEKILKLTEKQIQDLIYPVGFYKTKAKRIKQISDIIQKQYNGKIPENFNELLKLKGVGRKTANIVMVYGFNKDEYLPIDTHCHRIPNRLGWIKTKNPEETEQELKQILPKKHWKDFNHLFVIYGQTICLPISPYCSKCKIKKYCKQIKVIKKR